MVYFISDAHLGSRAFEHKRTQERKLVRFLDKIKDKADAIYLLGDMFDFWFEYKEVVPKGYTRFLGKLSELTDNGVEVHYFIGNHDMWMGDYLEKECGVFLHHEPCLLEIYGKEFYMAHGHTMDVNKDDTMTKIMLWCFQNKFLQRMARMIHPHWFINFGLNWAKHSRDKRAASGEDPYRGEENENLIAFAKKYLAEHPTVNYFIFGHRHIELDLMLSHDCRMMILGEWFSLFTYVSFDGKNIVMGNYIEGETEV
jgi:UDP-2,3-diacylglucosamine hydrolase